MKLDTSKTYGTIWGHDKAVYEQQGVLFDGGGNSLEDEEESTPVAAAGEGSIMDHIREALSGGPVTQTNLYRESQNEGFNWDQYKSTANEIGVRIYKQGSLVLWELKPL
jgi:hypothetical protein